MIPRRRTVAALLALLVALALPSSAWAHAALVRTEPSASGVVNRPPASITLTYSEPVEPRFAIVSVTDADGAQKSAAAPVRSPTDSNALVVRLKPLVKGWYLVYWRVVSVDGHPVRGAYTFAVGPNPGPAPQFVIPSISETATTPRLLAARWVVFLSVMAAIGLFVLRTIVARPVVRRVAGTDLRAVTIALAAAVVVALVATPVYVVIATAEFALRPVTDLGALLPLVRDSAFGRGYLDLELCLALFAFAAGVSIWLDRPEREQRSVAEVLALVGTLAAAGAVLVIPGLAGHAAQTTPRGASVLFDWLHLAAGSIWIGGLAGLLVLWRSLPAERRVAGLVVCVPRFSNVAFVSVLVLVASGIGSSVVHLPTLATLWETSYGKTLLIKIAILSLALTLAAGNLLRSKPRLQASSRRPELGLPAAALLRRLISGEIVLVAGAVFAAAVLSSLAPPSKALANIGKAAARVGPGPVESVVNQNGYRLQFNVAPNRAAVPNRFSVAITRGGKPVEGADVTTSFTMLDMEMGQQAYHLAETRPGVYEHAAPALVMVGHWGLSYEIEPPSGQPFTVVIVDRANG